MANGFMFDVPKSGGSGNAKIFFNNNLARRYEMSYNKAQKFLTNEVMKGCAPYMPMKTGHLIRTVEDLWNAVRWYARYAAAQYYKYGDVRPYDPMRGGHWFARWKTDNGAKAVETTRKIAGGRLI